MLLCFYAFRFYHFNILQFAQCLWNQKFIRSSVYVCSLPALDPAYYYGNEPSTSQNDTTLLVGGSSNNNSTDGMEITNGHHTQTIASPHEIRSPLAATRANSLASAASPTGSACTKTTSDTAAAVAIATAAAAASAQGAEVMFIV